MFNNSKVKKATVSGALAAAVVLPLAAPALAQSVIADTSSNGDPFTNVEIKDEWGHLTVSESETPVADPVVLAADPDVDETPYMTPVTVSVLDNDTMAENATRWYSVHLKNDRGLSIKTLKVAGEGTYVVNDDMTITFTPVEGFTGEATPVTYQAKDDKHLIKGVTSTLTITVGGMPAMPIVPAPVAADDSFAHDYEDGYETLLDIALNDPSKGYLSLLDENGNPVQEVTVTIGGEAAGVGYINEDGQFFIAWLENRLTGEIDPITYKVTDENGASVKAVITGTVTETIPAIPLDPAPQPEEPETPVDPEPEVPVEPEVPADPEPETPADPETPVDPDPDTPVEDEPVEPEPETPIEDEPVDPETPVTDPVVNPEDTGIWGKPISCEDPDQLNDLVSSGMGDLPLITTLEGLVSANDYLEGCKEPEVPEEPETPVDPEPEVPVEPVPEVPADPEPETPADPETPVDPDPETPVEVVDEGKAVPAEPKPEVPAAPVAEDSPITKVEDAKPVMVKTGEAVKESGGLWAVIAGALLALGGIIRTIRRRMK